MNKYIRIPMLLVIDAIIISFSVYLAFLLRFDFQVEPQFEQNYPYVITAYVVFSLISFYKYKIYKRVWRYASIGDLISIFKGSLVGTGVFFLLQHFVVNYFFPLVIVPRSIYILSAIMIFLGLGGSRFLWRMLRDNYSKIQPHHHRALIIGAGNEGIMVVKELKQSQSEYYPVAIIDDNVENVDLEVLGVPVVGGRSDIRTAVNQYEVDHIIIALPSVSRAEMGQILEICKGTGCQIKIIPRVTDLINGKISINMIRDVSVEDLLGREPINIDLKQISGYLSGKVILVTGAGGSIGSELCRQIAGFEPERLLILGRGENSIYDIEIELKKNFPHLLVEPIIADIQHKQRLDEIFRLHRPQVVFHAAAHKHVPLMEKNPIEAVKNNVLGTKNVAECSHENGVSKFVMVSTDKAVNPTSVMGVTKRIAEMIVQGLNQSSATCFSAVRFGNVLGSRGSVIPLFKRQIEQGGPVSVTHPDMVRYFMTIPEAVQLVIQAGALSKGGEVFILDMGKPVKILDLARDLIRLSGLEPDKDIQIIYTGIRPGEKLFEELLTAEEGTSATKHDRIYVGQSLQTKAEDLSVALKLFEYLASGNNHATDTEIREHLKRMVPSYFTSTEYTEKAAEEALRASLEVVAALDGKQSNNPKAQME
ncbi:polysaccharide biosynthesis protein [Paenibacillus sp. TRM 82003]|nr:polysaccharide biosynthesis protein [Paenibacillus sp. TRM 82003]